MTTGQTLVTEQTPATEIELRSISESIVHQLNTCDVTEIGCILRFIVGTRIPDGHDEIAKAWTKRAETIGWPRGEIDVLGGILRQKKAAEAKLARGHVWEKIDLEHLRGLLNSLDYHVNQGLSSGGISDNPYIQEQLTKMYEFLLSCKKG